MAKVVCEEEHIVTAISLVRWAIEGTESFAKNASKNKTERSKDKVHTAITKYAGEDGFARARDVRKEVFRGAHKREREDVLSSMIEDGEIVVQERSPPQGGPAGQYYAIARDLHSATPQSALSDANRTDGTGHPLKLGHP